MIIFSEEISLFECPSELYNYFRIDPTVMYNNMCMLYFIKNIIDFINWLLKNSVFLNSKIRYFTKKQDFASLI